MGRCTRRGWRNETPPWPRARRGRQCQRPRTVELAAKAAGLDISWSERLECAETWRDGDKIKRFWQPHRDDGDSLRLRNALQATIIDEGDKVYVEIARYPAGAIVREPYERDLPGGFASQSSVDAATRQAIVRAAAELGAKMQGGRPCLTTALPRPAGIAVGAVVALSPGPAPLAEPRNRKGRTGGIDGTRS